MSVTSRVFLSARAKSARLMTPRLRGSYAAKAARHRSRPSTPGPARLRSVNRSLRYSSVTPREWSVPNEGGRRRLGAAVYGRGWLGRSGAPQGEVPGAAEPGRSRWMPFVRSAPAMGAGLGGALAGTALGTDRGSVVVVGTALLGRSHSSVGRRPREKDMSPAPGARGGGGRCLSRRKCIHGLRSVSLSDDCFGLSQTARTPLACENSSIGLVSVDRVAAREDHFAELAPI